ncbi:MAG: lytic transglycosylase domain-containing protein [Bacteroidota bacterium]
MKKTILISIFPIGFLLILNLLSFVRAEKEDQDKDAYKQKLIDGYNIFALPIPDDLYFAGEKAPVDNFDIKERFDRELLVNTYWQSQTMLFFKRANKWFPVIESILEEEGIPDDFKYIALIESGLMNVVSPAGATGFWQILNTTGRELGLEVNNEVDERYHVEKSTRAACKFFNKAYEKFENWTLVAASYNMGKSGLSRRLEEQKVNSYYDLYLNEETSRYVFRILAIKTILENPETFGFHFRENDLYHPLDYYTVTADTTITDLVAFAQKHQITYKELKTLNPWIRKSSITNRSGKVYKIKIVKDSLWDTASVNTAE